jgi:hypothetical protein
MSTNLGKRTSGPKHKETKGKPSSKIETVKNKRIQGNNGESTATSAENAKKTSKSPVNKLYSQLIQKEKGAKGKKVELIKKILGLIEPIPKVCPLTGFPYQNVPIFNIFVFFYHFPSLQK